MSLATNHQPQGTVVIEDRRRQDQPQRPPGYERRQFADSRHNMDPEVRELADAIDTYKIVNGRRYITLAEVLQIIKSLGYHKD